MLEQAVGNGRAEFEVPADKIPKGQYFIRVENEGVPAERQVWFNTVAARKPAPPDVPAATPTPELVPMPKPVNPPIGR